MAQLADFIPNSMDASRHSDTFKQGSGKVNKDPLPGIIGGHLLIHDVHVLPGPPVRGFVQLTAWRL